MSFPTGWGKKVAITVDKTHVGSGGVTGFTVLLTEANLPSGIFTDARSDGGDIRASSDSAGSTELATDLIVWTPGSSKCVLRIGTLSLSSAANTTLYIWYGKSDATALAANDTYGQYNAYDSSWKAYWPLGGTGERTSNQNTLTASGTPGTASGKIGTASTFDGTTYYYRNSSVLGESPSEFSLLAWVSSVGAIADCLLGMGKSSSSTVFITWGHGSYNKLELMYRRDNGANNIDLVNTVTAFDGSWHHISTTLIAGTGNTKIYVDAGTPDTGTVSLSASAIDRTSVGNLLCGTAAQQYTGSVNEAQVHSSARSAAWITTEYNQTNAPGTFASAGTPETISGTSSSRRRRLICGSMI